jgi:hypothetical protein
MPRQWVADRWELARLFMGVRESGGDAGYGLDVGAVVGEFAWVVTGAWCDRADFVFPN